MEKVKVNQEKQNKTHCDLFGHQFLLVQKDGKTILQCQVCPHIHGEEIRIGPKWVNKS